MSKLINEKITQPEHDKLVQEIQQLIEKTGLAAELKMVETAGRVERGGELSGCARCTMCPCMICW